MTNYFELLGVPQQFHIDSSQLINHYRKLQQTVHPDRFAGGGERERLRAVQKTAELNEGFETLKAPVKRARHLMMLAGHELPTEFTFNDNAFLMQQLELREHLSELKNADNADNAEAALDKLYDEIKAALDEQQQAFVECLEQQSFDGAGAAIAKMQFLEKLRNEATALEEELLDY